ncbi:MAG: ATP-binding protein [Pseudomonadales bacterium]
MQSFVVITAASATLRKRYYLRVFLGLSMLNVIAVSLVLPNPEVTPALFGLQLVTYSLFMYFIISSGISAGERQQLTEDRLRHSEASLYRAQGIARMGGWEYDGEGTLEWSKSLWDLIELEQSENPEAQAVLSVMDDEHREALTEHIDDLMSRRGQEFEFETAMVTSAGKTMDVRVLGQRNSDPSASARVVGTIQDISGQAEEARLLNRARAAAESAAAARTQFVANMSHEIRTPMNGVIGMTALLQETELNDQQRAYLQIVQSSGDALLNIIDSILDFSKIDSGQLKLESHAFSLEDCLAGAIDVVLPTAQEKGLEVLFEWDPGLPLRYLGDSNRIRQIVLNLLGNAVKFTDVGEVCLSARAADSAPDGDDRQWLWMSVTDTGVGIAPAALADVFDAFIQADASTTREFGGTGLGLNIAKELVELMGGEISVESASGQGSVFHIRLPLETAWG